MGALYMHINIYILYFVTLGVDLIWLRRMSINVSVD